MLKQGDVVESGPFAGFEVIDVYSRADAIEDGVLVDVSEVAREAGIKFPVALTRAVWSDLCEVPEGVECQDVQGRLWDVVWMLSCAIRSGKPGPEMTYELMTRGLPDRKRAEYQARGKRGKRALQTVTLKALCGPGDDLAPVITVMQVDES